MNERATHEQHRDEVFDQLWRTDTVGEVVQILEDENEWAALVSMPSDIAHAIMREGIERLHEVLGLDQRNLIALNDLFHNNGGEAA